MAISLDGQPIAHLARQGTVPAAFSTTETFDVGVDLGSPVSLDYFERSPFAFAGTIASMKVELL